MRISTGLVIGAVTIGMAVGVGEAAGQTAQSHIGPRVSYNVDAEEFGVGAQFAVPIGRRLEFYPSFDYFFVDVGNLWALNADIKYRATTGGSLDWLYLGGGLNVTGFSAGPVDETDVGANLLLGLESLRGRVHPFAEGRLTIGDGSTFQISAGLNLTIGTHRR